jgi:hypothetical protein
LVESIATQKLRGNKVEICKIFGARSAQFPQGVCRLIFIDRTLKLRRDRGIFTERVQGVHIFPEEGKV